MLPWVVMRLRPMPRLNPRMFQNPLPITGEEKIEGVL